MILKKTYINCPYVVSKFEAHESIKEKLLELIHTQNSNSVVTIGENISTTDWNVDIGKNREYWNFLYPYLKPHVDCVYDSLNIIKRDFTNYWYQQYSKNDYHDWHEHGTSWSNVYYLELPNDELRTQVISPVDGTIFSPEVYEGYILSMPGILKHRSPPNVSEDRKTVIAFNIKVFV